MNVLLRRDIDLDSITLLLYITLGLIHMVGRQYYSPLYGVIFWVNSISNITCILQIC